jgi:hypothetical protein
MSTTNDAKQIGRINDGDKVRIKFPADGVSHEYQVTDIHRSTVGEYQVVFTPLSVIHKKEDK